MEIVKNPLWFKNAIIYQLHVKGFYDTRENGVGDFIGLTEKLDYLESLGITAIWLLPFYPSPLKDDGYDIADYRNIHSNYGTLQDFRNFLKAAHKRSIKIIIELVINHTSDQHRWFQLARKSPENSSQRNFYIWNNDTDLYKEARIIFKDFETSNWTWDHVAQSYYFHRFYSHQPDLNFKNPLVQKEVLHIVDFWLKMGVDGLRLDAIPYLFKKEHTNCENLPETHLFIKKLRQYVDRKYKDRVLIAEANQWPEDAALYFGKGDECHMAFHFPVMPRLFMAIHMEDRFPIIDILDQTPTPPQTCQWILFLRNHDELTLEMVSDEERDYMYHTYAKDPKSRINLGIRRRLAPLLGNDRKKIELLDILLFSIPGTPAIYYGDEIGMGDNYYLGDRNGVRTPMQWNSDKNAGFSKANPQKLYLPLIIDPPYHYAFINVENQEQNPSSLLWWLRRVLSIRKNHKAFGVGSLEFVLVDNTKILAFTLTHEEEIILVVANLSRFSQAATLTLSKYTGYIPQELFHENDFPPIEEDLYTMTFGPHGYFWLSLHPKKRLVTTPLEEETVQLSVKKKWQNVFKGKSKKILEKTIFPQFLIKSRWFEHKTYSIQCVRLAATVPIKNSVLCIVEVSFHEIAELDKYLVPISFTSIKEIENGSNFIAPIKVDAQEGILYDSIYDETFRKALLLLLAQNHTVKSDKNKFVSYIRHQFKKEVIVSASSSQVLFAEQSNSSIIYGQRFFFKLFRKLEEGIHPEVTLNRFLTEQAHFPHTPPFIGSISYKKSQSQPATIGFLEIFIPNEGTAWNFTLEALSQFYEQVLALKESDKKIINKPSHTPEHISLFQELIDKRFLDAVQMLAERTAEMHIALTTSCEDIEFKPEPYTTLYQRSLYQEMRKITKKAYELIKKNLPSMDDTLKKLSSQILPKQDLILEFFQKIIQKPFDGLKIRTHSDYHLSQVLYTGKDFIIIDFEGEPLYPLNSRLRKRSPLRDVAGMLRSFHYAAQKAFLSNTSIHPESIALLEPWANAWYEQIRLLFTQSYLQTIRKHPLILLPSQDQDIEFLLNAFILEKTLYEIVYELNVRPKWALIPLKGILFLLQHTLESS